MVAFYSISLNLKTAEHPTKKTRAHTIAHPFGLQLGWYRCLFVGTPNLPFIFLNLLYFPTVGMVANHVVFLQPLLKTWVQTQQKPNHLKTEKLANNPPKKNKDYHPQKTRQLSLTKRLLGAELGEVQQPLHGGELREGAGAVVHQVFGLRRFEQFVRWWVGAGGWVGGWEGGEGSVGWAGEWVGWRIEGSGEWIFQAGKMENLNRWIDGEAGDN